MKSACWLLVVMMVVVVDVYAGSDGPYSNMTEERRKQQRKPQDCYVHYEIGGQKRSDRYKVYLGKMESPVEVYCDMSGEGGWTVIQRRKDDGTDFNRDWMAYKEGFGDLRGSFWLGNENLHLLTTQRRYLLRVQLRDWRNKERFVECDNFSVGPESEKFELISVGTCTGSAKDAMTYHLHSKFSTKDEDNDDWDKCSCANKYNAGWWYKQCSDSNLNGQYYKGGKLTNGETGIEWVQWMGASYSLKWTQMSVRPLYL